MHAFKARDFHMNLFDLVHKLYDMAKYRETIHTQGGPTEVADHLFGLIEPSVFALQNKFLSREL